MPIPVISTTTSVLGYRRAQPFAYQMQATESPTSWTASGLPAGMTIDNTGLISGAALVAGVYLLSVVATNATGPSVALPVAMGIEESYSNDGIGIELNVDLRSGGVSAPGISATLDAPTLFLKFRDKVFIDIGLFKDTTLQEMNVTQVIINIREFDGETILVQSTGAIEVVGTVDQPRYRILLDLDTPEMQNVLGNYEGDFRTTFNAIAEIEWQVTYAEPGALSPDVVRTSQTFRIAIDRDLIAN